MKYITTSKIFLMVLVCLFTGNAFADITLLDNLTYGYYNTALGTILDGTQSQFPLANSAGGDPVINPALEPDLTVASSILGNWLSSNPIPLNSNWSGLQSIPATWAYNTETAIIYEIDSGPGILNLRGNFGVDNGIFVWVNGIYKFGAIEPGGATQFEYSNIDLGNLSSGKNYIQILREDHGPTTGYTIQITGAVAPEPISSTLFIIGGATLGFRRFIMKFKK